MTGKPVTFGYDGDEEYSRDRNYPYTIAGESEWDYKALPQSLLTKGPHQITASLENGKALTLNFELTE